VQVGLICEQPGVHERRFAAAFTEAGHDVLFLTREVTADLPALKAVESELAARRGLLFGGPLTACAPWASPHRNLPMVAVSYAFDVLLQAGEDPAKAAVMRQVLASADGLVTDCRTVLDACLGMMGGRTIPSVCVPWGLDRHAAGSSETIRADRTGSGNVFISLRNFTPLHGVADTVQAFASICPKLPSARLLLAGSGSGETDLRCLTHDCGIRSRVDFLGSIAEAEIPSLLQRADIYVSSSRVDGVSISMLQAMEAGLPLILSDVGGNREISEENGPIWKFPQGDVTALAAAMLQCAGRNSGNSDPWRKYLRQHADWQTNRNAIIRLCESTATRYWNQTPQAP
jgi:glycosyltransferase involved in cell wall biosynthesis